MITIPPYLHQPLSLKTGFLLFVAALTIRAATMLFFIQPGGYFSQPDSIDYHNCAASVATGQGMYHYNSTDPIFWRTPGYPVFLALFYKLFGPNPAYHENKTAQKAAIWAQIIISSCIPIVLFYLSYILTSTYLISWVTAIISSIHPGLVLASTFLLTEGLALILFYLFLCFLFTQLIPQHHHTRWLSSIIGSALFLSAFTWIRPMGEVVGITTTLLLLFGSIGSLRQKSIKSLLFFVIFFASLAPWYLRNHSLSDEWFFNPTSGPYFTCFCAPKVMSHVSGRPLIDCWRDCQQLANITLQKKKFFLRGTNKHASPLTTRDAMVNIIKQSPFWFVVDWLQETIKTTFDLYSYQLVSMMNNTFWYDPLQEFLSEKIAITLWTDSETIPLTVHFIGWLEFACALLMWIGLCAGAWLFVLKPVLFRHSAPDNLQRLYITAGIMIACIIAPTGGFGYARLRLPAEPLLWILALAYWSYFLHHKGVPSEAVSVRTTRTKRNKP